VELPPRVSHMRGQLQCARAEPTGSPAVAACAAFTRLPARELIFGHLARILKLDRPHFRSVARAAVAAGQAAVA
ncbi:MAG: hypothetical protein ACXW2I_16815, partial [Burkholderiales bacterium]